MSQIIIPSFHLSIIDKVTPLSAVDGCLLNILDLSLLVLVQIHLRHRNNTTINDDDDRQIPPPTSPLNRMSVAEPIQSILEFHLRPGFCPCSLSQIASSPLLPFPSPFCTITTTHGTVLYDWSFLSFSATVSCLSFLLLNFFPCLLPITSTSHVSHSSASK